MSSGRPRPSNQQHPNVDDDEAYARMLQFQEQATTTAAAATPPHSGDEAFGGGSAYSSQQELRDLELARELFRKEMEGGGGAAAAAAATPPQQPPQPQLYGYEAGHSQGIRPTSYPPQQRSPPDQDEEYARTWQNSISEMSFASPVLRRHPSADDPLGYASGVEITSPSSSVRHHHSGDNLDYARRLQEQAFRDLDRRGGGPDDSVSSDLQIARRLQDLEDRGFGGQNTANEVYNGNDDGSLSEHFENTSREELLESITSRATEVSWNRNSSTTGVSGSTAVPHRTMESRYSPPDDNISAGTDINNIMLSPQVLSSSIPPAARRPNSADGVPRGTVAMASLGSVPITPGESSSDRFTRPLGAAHSASPTPARRLRRDDVANTKGLPTLDPLCGDALQFLDVPVPPRERKKKLRNFLGFGAKKPPPAASSDPNTTASVSLPTTPVHAAAATLSSIPPPPGGESISALPPFSPVRRPGLHPAPSISSTSGTRLASSRSPATPRQGRIGPGGVSLSVTAVVPASPATTLRPGPLPHSVSVQRSVYQNTNSPSQTGIHYYNGEAKHLSPASNVCCVCQQSGGGQFLAALDRKYHVGCFRCVSCNKRIDASRPFAFNRDEHGWKQPYHRRCFAATHGVKCAVCSEVIPATRDGTVCFVKHPFFDTEQMCPRHADNPGRRCTGCHRFEPVNEPFADLYDAGRCVCYACCRTVVVDNADVEPLWAHVLSFFENQLKLPVWNPMRDIPVLVVQSQALDDQMDRGESAHRGASQIMARGLCLTDLDVNDHAVFKLPMLKFERTSSVFEAQDNEERGFTYFEVPSENDGTGNPDATVFAILCLSGLPRDLTLSILAHEATHAWIKLHPKYDMHNPLPAQVEEGCAQLVSMLMLSNGLAGSTTDDNACAAGNGGDGGGPSDEKLRQYFQFSIERDDDDVYGAGYRKAAAAYRAIGIEALLSHVIRYREFPST